MATATTALKKTHCFRRMIASPSRSASTTASSVAYNRRSRSNSRPTSPLTCNLGGSLSQKLSSSSTELRSDGTQVLDTKRFSPLSSPLKETFCNNFQGPTTSGSSSSLHIVRKNDGVYSQLGQGSLQLKLRRYNSTTSLG